MLLHRAAFFRTAGIVPRRESPTFLLGLGLALDSIPGTWAIAACGGGGGDACAPLDITDLDVSCTKASDCTPVYAGSYCGDCHCPGAAINVADMAKYQALAQAAGADQSVNLCDCVEVTPICTQGKCGVMMP